MDKNILSLVGNTPLVKLSNLTIGTYAQVYVKLESQNPTGSVKDRAALAMIKAAEKDGLIKKDTVIVEPSSGNTGIALAFICAVKGYKLIVTMPESMSVERRRIITGFGAEIVLTPAPEGMKGAIAKAQELAAMYKNSYIPYQFINPANPQMHFDTTAQEIWKDMSGAIDVFIAGVGTGGTITGVSNALKIRNPELYSVAVEPKDSPVLSGGQPAPHKIQGIGAGFVPEILKREYIDEIVTVSNEDAINTARTLMLKEGIFCGISSGANVFVALTLANDKKYSGKNIVTIICDTGERYLSTVLFE